MPTPLTKTLIATHERLYPRLAALLKQVERVAGRQPVLVVPEETAKLSRVLVREAAKLLGREGKGIAVPQASPGAGRAARLDHAGLSIVLGQALAGLEAFEAAYSGPSRDGVVVWQLEGGERLPVARLRAARTGVARSFAEPVRDPYTSDVDTMRATVLKRILIRENAVYLEGYRDGRSGKPPRKPKTEIGPVNEDTETN